MIYLITGGQRSGKSKFAEEMALNISDTPVYIATSRIWDNEMKLRVNQHQSRRSLQWSLIEEEKYISNYNLNNKVVVIDCVTLWIANFFFDLEESVETSFQQLQSEIEKIASLDGTYIFVTNEIGMGLIGETSMSRKFTDLHGMVNQMIASKAEQVILMISGIPVEIKNNGKTIQHP